MATAFAVEDRTARPWSPLFTRVGDFLTENGLDPSPANYELVHLYLQGEDIELIRRVDDAVQREGRLSPSAAAGIIALRDVEISAVDLARTADEAQGHLGEISTVVERSGQDARDFGDALERIADGSDASMVQGLIATTREMIARMRTAEADLRRTGEEIALLRQNLAEAQRIADTDALTGLPNRRALDARLRAAIECAREAKSALTVAICDIDHFKAVNDQHGHPIGDEVIKFFAGALGRTKTCKPFVARYGGEEFVMLFEGVDATLAAAEIDRVRTDLAGREFKITSTGKQLGRLTFSGGVAELARTRGGSGALLKSADAALYRAKREGRNQVRIAD